jgi:hypothetical protein
MLRLVLVLVAGLAGSACNDDGSQGLGPQVPPSGDLLRNLPSGWTTVSAYGFDDVPPAAQDGVAYERPLGGGWTILFWGTPGGGPKRLADDASPASPGYVLEEVYPPHLSGGGTSAVFRDVPSTDKLYVSWVVKWEAGFHHNNTSEKLIYFNPDDSDYFIFQFHWGAESIYNIRGADGDGSLWANQRPRRPADGVHDAPPLDGEWIEYELLFDRAAGTAKWWRNGVLHGDHSGRSFPRLNHVKLDTTWGGGGDKQGTHSRFTDHFFVAVGS